MSGFPYLSVLTVAPAVGAIGVASLPKSRPELAKRISLAWSVAVLGLAVAMWVGFDPAGPRLQFYESYRWIPAWGAKFTFAADGIALVMLALIALLVPLVILASWHDAEGGRR